MNAQAYFKVEGLHKNFGGLTAVNELTFAVEKGAIHGLIGPNGAGKTTIFNVISGFYKPSAGKVLYEGESIGGLQPHQVAAKGLVRTFQETTLFQEFTTFENALMGRYLHTEASMISALFGTQRKSERANEEKTMEVLEFLGLAERKDELALNLPHGLQRALGIAVALMGRNHPIGVFLAALLFGALYQGGTELSFEMPNITRHMVVVIQGLVILFSGALEHMLRPRIESFFVRRTVAVE
ncbi:MAG: ATP-binding cassette domain-containing protein [Alphaproteobacteria bacterium]|nr:ATP-binding cassette domain-containing protein [Alphaproteobacteria bacterium]